MKYLKIFVIALALSLLNKIAYSKIETEARFMILQDFFSGEILYEKDADEKIYPASMTKIMTTIVAFDFLKNRGLVSSISVFLAETGMDPKLKTWFFLYPNKALDGKLLMFLVHFATVHICYKHKMAA